MRHSIRQKPIESVSPLQDPTQQDICAEPIFRRATPDFVRGNGGDIARLFLQQLERIGMINDQSRLMCQRSLLIAGAFPSPPNWHVDYMPGTPNNFSEHICNPVQGAIASVCSPDKVSTTIFLEEGMIELEEPENNILLATGGEYLEATIGHFNWCTAQIEALRSEGRVSARSIVSNLIHRYDSTNLHRAPQFSETGGCRLILRANTPPNDYPNTIPYRNELIQHPDFYFTVTDGRWEKHIVGS